VRSAATSDHRRAALHDLLERIGAGEAARELLGQPA
jgi:hypothetical protein